MEFLELGLTVQMEVDFSQCSFLSLLTKSLKVGKGSKECNIFQNAFFTAAANSRIYRGWNIGKKIFGIKVQSLFIYSVLIDITMLDNKTITSFTFALKEKTRVKT